MQTVARNPLADLTVMGVSGGAGFGAALVLVALPSVPYAALPVAALLGGAAAFALTYGLSLRKGSVAPERLVLVGVGTFALTTAATNYLVVGARFQVAQALTWLSGSTYARDAADLSVLAGAAAVGVPLLALSFWRLDLLALGEDTPARWACRWSGPGWRCWPWRWRWRRARSPSWGRWRSSGWSRRTRRGC